MSALQPRKPNGWINGLAMSLSLIIFWTTLDCFPGYRGHILPMCIIAMISMLIGMPFVLFLYYGLPRRTKAD